LSVCGNGGDRDEFLSALDEASFATVFSRYKLLFILKSHIHGITPPYPTPTQVWLLSKEEVADNSQVFRDVTLLVW
jgi:hypothetical protein